MKIQRIIREKRKPKDEPEGSMRQNAYTFLSLVLIIGVLFMVSSIYSWIGPAASDEATSTEEGQPADVQAFYATIVGKQDDSISVIGIGINDINFQGEFVLYVDAGTKVMNNEEYIGLDGLSTADIICVIFDGGIAETSPAQIDGVMSIRIVSKAADRL